jgi:hypothetical protein
MYMLYEKAVAVAPSQTLEGVKSKENKKKRRDNASQCRVQSNTAHVSIDIPQRHAHA